MQELICLHKPGKVYGSGRSAADPESLKQFRFFKMTLICAVQSRGADAAVLHSFLCNMTVCPDPDYGGADGISWQGRLIPAGYEF